MGTNRNWLNWTLGLIPVAVVLVLGLLVANEYLRAYLQPDPAPTAALSPTRTPTATGAPSATPTVRPSPTSTPTIVRTPTPSPPPGGNALALTPAPADAGWVVSSEPVGNHLNDADARINSGVFSGTVYYGALQFALTAIPPGTPLTYAALELTGLASERVAPGGNWSLSLIDTPAESTWSAITFQQVQNALAVPVGAPVESSAIAVGRTNVFDFGPEALHALEARLARGRVSFRLTGPGDGPNNLATWDSGTQQGTLGFKPVLRIGSGPFAATATSTMVVVTSTPLPRNAATAGALAASATYIAETIGTATPAPANWATPLMVTATPEPPDVFAAATQSARMTAVAANIGTATPTPLNWVTPIVVTATPTPANAATAQYRAALATAIAATTGTATPTPFNMLTATPTPLLVPYTPAPPTFVPPTPTALPAELKGRIAFMSDRDGTSAAYVMNAGGDGVAKLTGPWPYQFALARDAVSTDDQYRLLVQGDLKSGTRIVLLDSQQHASTLFDAPGINYDPAFAPDNYTLAFVSTTTGVDQLYVITRDTSGLRQLTHTTWEFNKHPSWAPNGQQLVWWSNRETGRKQVWRMNADGTNALNLSNNAYNDWDPVWMK